VGEETKLRQFMEQAVAPLDELACFRIHKDYPFELSIAYIVYAIYKNQRKNPIMPGILLRPIYVMLRFSNTL